MFGHLWNSGPGRSGGGGGGEGRKQGVRVERWKGGVVLGGNRSCRGRDGELAKGQ